jgi:hypothetical protein
LNSRHDGDAERQENRAEEDGERGLPPDGEQGEREQNEEMELQRGADHEREGGLALEELLEKCAAENAMIDDGALQDDSGDA